MGYRFFFCLFFCLSSSAQAVMPPDFYARLAENSGVKAIARVADIEILEKNRRSTQKRVRFELIHSMGPPVGEVFYGTCFSVDYSWQQPGEGGTIYFYPVRGVLVFVTIAADGGSITSYTPITEKSAGLFVQNPERIRYGMGRAWLEEIP
ncbi:hypothetical protein OOT00_12130 [Desulfobotulus sp. H1]|uniref:Uncharacterized protein n=1 Tax=Desulfobotulus pelophilus TaxID=2823377 RepID=A0ABT3NB93_9BACT|nr:hypothetical protein [Desulfobotulus pelophilus]MCW7754729.1 hypothetical protein [Desulfobotulus pelophilus]